MVRYGLFMWILIQGVFFGKEILLDLYKRPIPVTFGVLTDLHCRLFSLENTGMTHKTTLFISKSGGIQLKIVFFRSRLPKETAEAESLIEDLSLKIKKDAQERIRGLWALYPHEIPEYAFLNQNELIDSFIFVDGNQIGQVSGDVFYWKKQTRPQKVIRNKY